MKGDAERNMLRSLSLFVGTGRCNANCAHCAGKIHRKYAPKKDGEIDRDLISKTLRDCYMQGARSLSLSGSGEPTLSPVSVTNTLDMVNRFSMDGMRYNPINLYSNGIRIGQDKDFCETYLRLWKNLGLTRIYLTIHDIDERENARIYGVRSYPKLEKILSRIHEADLLVRANLMLSKETIGTYSNFKRVVDGLVEIGVDSIAAWQIRGSDDKVDLNLCPNYGEIGKMLEYVSDLRKREFDIRLNGEEYQQNYIKGTKLTLFPDGNLSNSWCK